jgi:hypothetical protein
MKVAVAKQDRNFFQKKGWIEFEDFLTSDQVVLLHQTIDQALAERLQIPITKLSKQNAAICYLQGHDLWRQHAALHQFVIQTRFGEVINELIGKKILRLGYDQLFPSSSQALLYAPFVAHTPSLDAVSSLNGIVCGVMIALEETEQPIAGEEKTHETEGIDIFPSQRGYVRFFLPHLPINWSRLYKGYAERFYLIAYTRSLSFYHLEPKDPHTHALKHLGYIFNSQLTDKLNPIIYRP